MTSDKSKILPTLPLNGVNGGMPARSSAASVGTLGIGSQSSTISSHQSLGSGYSKAPSAISSSPSPSEDSSEASLWTSSSFPSSSSRISPSSRRGNFELFWAVPKWLTLTGIRSEGFWGQFLLLWPSDRQMLHLFLRRVDSVGAATGVWSMI